MSVHFDPVDPDFSKQLQNVQKSMGETVSSNTKKADFNRDKEQYFRLDRQLLENPTVAAAKEAVQFYVRTDFTDFKQRIISTLLTLHSGLLDGILDDLLNIMGVELGAESVSIDIGFLTSLMERMDVLVRERRDLSMTRSFDNLLTQAKQMNNEKADKMLQQIRPGGTVPNLLVDDPTMPVNASIKNLPLDTPLPKPSIATDVEGTFHVAMSDIGEFDVSVSSGKKAIKVESKDRQMKMQVKPPDIFTEIVHKDATLHAAGTTGNVDPSEWSPIVAAIVVISMPNLMVVAIDNVLAQLMVHMGRLDDNKNIHQVAVVVDNVATLHKMDELDNVRRIDVNRELTDYTFYEEYLDLYNNGYRFIISLHLNPHYRKTHQMAEQAVKRLYKQVSDVAVHTYNTQANGVGLGLLLQEVIDAIQNHYRPTEVEQLVRQIISQYQHWICPLAVDYIRNHHWVMKLADNQKKVKLRLFRFKPISSIKEKIEIMDVYYSEEKAVSALVDFVGMQVKKKRQKLHRIGIEYKGVYRVAINVSNRLKVRYPNVKITMHTVGSVTSRLFGPDLIGICLL